MADNQLSVFIDPNNPIYYEVQRNGKYIVSGLHYGLKEVAIMSDTQCYVKYIENENPFDDNSLKFLKIRICTIKDLDYKLKDVISRL